MWQHRLLRARADRFCQGARQFRASAIDGIYRMTSAQSLVRSLLIYAICLPLAVFLGYLLTTPADYGSILTLGTVIAFLCVPLLIRFHYPLMLVSWNMVAVLFFLPGRPPIWMAAIALSFAISFTQRILNKDMRGIQVPEISRPLIAMMLVILVTAQLTGGIGLRAFGGDVYGGRRYFALLLTILGYFALSAFPIPKERAYLYTGLFFLGAITLFIGDLSPLLSGFQFIFWLFPPYSVGGGFQVGITRLAGLTAASAAIYCYMLARYGIRGIFLSNRPTRMVLFMIFASMGLLGGFRSLVISFAGVFIVQFYLEGLHRTRFLPIVALAAALAASSAVAFASKMPVTVQRALAFLPVDIDPLVRESAAASTAWRVKMWKAVLPQIPQYILLGKGMGLSPQDYAYSTQFSSRALTEDQWGSALAGDYHSGPLSLIIPFGIWGVIVFVWFQVAVFRVLHNNFRYGDPALKSINTFLFASYIIRVFMFWFVVGGFVSDMTYFVGYVGLSVALNRGVARQAMQTVQTSDEPVKNLASIVPRPRPIFGR
jgi:hypothetical protein